MAELFRNKQVYTLLEIGKSIQQTLSEAYPMTFWVKTEINKLNYYPHSGHCYPELVEKKDGKVIAQMRSIMWRADFDRVNATFIHTLREPLKDGIKVMMLCTVAFDPSYGLSLKIHDIDPSYSLGDLEQEKNTTIKSLQQLGIFDSNKQLELPLLPKRLAIISVESSKGYADFMEVINNNPWHYKFFHILFPAVLQGEAAVKSIIWQLLQIKKVKQHFDAVVIIRGGGGDVGLSCYNHLDLASCIAAFPIPVLTGIGHATNETVSELVSHYNAITPTKLAEFIIQKYHNFSIPVQEAETLIKTFSKQLITDQKAELNHTSKYFKSLTKNKLQIFQTQLMKLSSELITASKERIQEDKNIVDNCSKDLFNNVQHIKRQETHQLEQLKHTLKSVSINAITAQKQAIQLTEKTIDLLNPINLLKRGYTITLKHNTIIKSAKDLQKGDTITTQFADGTTTSEIK